MKVLLIDDEALGMRALFSRLGAEVIYASTEEEGKSILTQQSVDVILMDGSLGNDVYGADVVKRLRTAGITTKIVMFSSDEKYNKAGIASGANGKWNKKLMGDDGWREKLLKKLQ